MAQGGQSASVPTVRAGVSKVGTAQARLCPPYESEASRPVPSFNKHAT